MNPQKESQTPGFNSPDSALISLKNQVEDLTDAVFKKEVECRKLEAQLKKLQDINTLNAKNTNNTSSTFSLPSEFKNKWDELVTENIIDAFGDFLDDYKVLIPLVHELFISINDEIDRIKGKVLDSVQQQLNIPDDANLQHLTSKFQSIFQEYSQHVFKMSKEDIVSFLENYYVPKLTFLDEEQQDTLNDNIKQADFTRFVETAMRLAVHMALNDPPIQIGVISSAERNKKEKLLDQFEYWMYNKQEYYCVDGFPSEGDPCVVVLPPPYRKGYVYQGIKPAVIGLDNSQVNDELKEHVRVKQEELLEKLKLKRQTSLVREEEVVTPEIKQEKPMVMERVDSLNERDFEIPEPPKIEEFVKNEEESICVLQPSQFHEVNSQLILGDTSLVIQDNDQDKNEPGDGIIIPDDADDEATVLKSSVRVHETNKYKTSNKENSQSYQSNVDNKLKVYYDAYVTSKNNGKSKYFNQQSKDKKELIREEIMRLNENRKSQMLKTQSLKQELAEASNSSRWYDMPKKPSDKAPTPYSNVSVVAEMHHQVRKTEFQKELHRKISNCKNMLQKAQPFGAGQSKLQRPKSPFERIDNVYNKVGDTKFQTLDTGSKKATGRNMLHKKQSDMISSIREAHQQKMTTLQNRLDQEKNNMRSRITSRSRSPMIREKSDYSKKGVTSKTRTKRQSTIQFDSSSSDSEEDFRSATRADHKYKRTEDKTFVVSPKPMVTYRGGPLCPAGTSTLQKSVALRRTMECQAGFSKRPSMFT